MYCVYRCAFELESTVDGSISEWRLNSAYQWDHFGIVMLQSFRITGMTMANYPLLAICIPDSLHSHSATWEGEVFVVKLPLSDRNHNVEHRRFGFTKRKETMTGRIVDCFACRFLWIVHSLLSTVARVRDVARCGSGIDRV